MVEFFLLPQIILILLLFFSFLFLITKFLLYLLLFFNSLDILRLDLRLCLLNLLIKIYSIRPNWVGLLFFFRIPWFFQLLNYLAYVILFYKKKVLCKLIEALNVFTHFIVDLLKNAIRTFRVHYSLGGWLRYFIHIDFCLAWLLNYWRKLYSNYIEGSYDENVPIEYGLMPLDTKSFPFLLAYSFILIFNAFFDLLSFFLNLYCKYKGSKTVKLPVLTYNIIIFILSFIILFAIFNLSYTTLVLFYKILWWL